MSLLSSAEVNEMRAVAEEAFDTTAVVMSGTTVSDGGGGGTAGWVPLGTFSCRFAPLQRGTGEEVEGERVTDTSEVIFTFPAEAEITHEVQIVSQGQTFAVTEIRNRSQELTRRVQARVIE